ncbi:MAG: hypothetical protein IH624_16075 [Phycisphaerae bacterium]|nr:hypothetical protein [Phycisphaerae bacterium]
MRKCVALLVITGLLMSGCAGRNANPIPLHVPGDDARGCESLKVEMAQMHTEMERILPKTNKTGSNALLGAAGVFLIVPWFFMDLKGADKVEFDALRNRHNYLLAIYADKECNMEGMAPVPSNTEMKKMLEEQKKQAAKEAKEAKAAQKK